MTPAQLSGSESGKNAFPLSQGQRGLWFLQQLHPGSAAYNIARAAGIRQSLDVDTYRRAWQRVVDRHPALRTTFISTPSGPMQVVHPQREVCFHYEDASLWSPEQLDRRLAEETYRPFDLERGPLLRIHLFRKDEDNFLGLLVLHHIVCDLWSLNLLLLESSHLYQAILKGAPAALRPLRSDYAGFVRSQAEMLAGPEGERLWAYWRDRLRGELPTLNMPTDSPRPVVPTDRAASVSLDFGMKLAGALKRLAQAHGTNSHTVALTAFQALLHRYTGQTDIMVGSPYAGRRSALTSIVGYVVNTLIFRAQFTPDQTFAHALERARQTVSDDLAHGAYPFPLLVERLQPERDLSRAPLFQVMFAWQKTSRLVDRDALAALNSGCAGKCFDLGGMSFETESFRHRTSVFDLTLHAAETSRGLSVVLDFNTALFDENTALRMLRCYETLLEGIAARPDRPISDLPLLPEEERERVLVGWNRTQADYPRDLCLHHLFETQAARTPEAVAVSFGSQSLTYAELNRRANQLAHRILSLGAVPGAPVGLCMERSLEMCAGVLGILKAGCACLPLDPAYPPARLAQMLADAQSPILLTRQSLVGRLPKDSGHVICVDTARPMNAESPAAEPQGGATPETAAYVLYTSGSTGRPKGVVMDHGALVNLITWQMLASTPGAARTLQFASLSFDVSFQEIFSTWHSGGALVLIEEEVRRDGAALLHYLVDEKIERLFVPLVTLQQLAEAYERGGPPPACLGDVITAGEALRITPQIVELFKALPQCALHNHYGPTESHVATGHKLEGAPDEWPAMPPIGRPIANTRLLILDDNRQPVPIGVPGELYIGGVGLAQGYLNDPDLTAERFIEIDRSLIPNSQSTRFYMTGDLARHLADGNVEFLCRLDDQVKIRGFRVEPGEIEAVLGEHPDVRQAAVSVLDHSSSRRRLVAYIVPPVSDSGSLRRFLAARLPEYMLPAAFVGLEALPLTASGKVDRSALPAPAPDPGKPDAIAAPRTAIEEELTRIWAEVLGRDSLGIRDDFFELGGHSLLATQIVARLRDVFRVDLPLRSLFETPTIASMADRIQTDLQSEPARELPPILPVPRDQPLPLSFSQERMWFIQQLAPESSAYNISAALRLAGPVRRDALRYSLNQIVRRHESLRTTFGLAEGQPVQIVAAPSEIKITEVDLMSFSADEREQEAQRLVNAESQRPFDLSRGPLFRVSLYCLGERDHLLLLAMHHIISDAWSLGVLGRELRALYLSATTGEPLSLTDPPIQYADFAHWQRNWFRGEIIEAQLNYWRRQLAGVQVLELPADRPRPALQSHRGTYLSRPLPGPLLETIRELSRTAGVTLFMTLLAAFKVLLYRYTGQTDIAVGTPIANRKWRAVEDLIGTFVNTLVLRTHLGGEATFREFLGHVREVALEAYTHQDISFAKLVAELHPQRDPSHWPLFQVMFNLINLPAISLELAGTEMKFYEADRRGAQFDLTLTVIDMPDTHLMTIEYNTDVFDAETMERLAGHYLTLLEGIAAGLDRRLDALPLLTDEARRHVLAEWNATKRDYPDSACVHQMFSQQAERTPEAVAVVGYSLRQGLEETLTYRELNRRSNQLAHYLQRLGVGPGVAVGISMERTTEMIIGLIGVLKAGGAYVPLDPAFPRERLAFMIRDAQAPVLLTQQSLLAELPVHSAHVVCLDGDWDAIARENATEPAASAAAASDLAYIIYTSGSTGKPKGVQIPHRGLINFMLSMQLEPGLSERDRLLAVTTLSFDIVGLELCLPLVTGARVIIAPQDVAMDGERLVNLLARSGTTVMQATPATWQMLVDAGWKGTPGLKMLCGGEILPHNLAEHLLKLGGTLWNMYGPTETTIWSSTYEVKPGDEWIHLGHPIANTQFYVLDKQHQPVPLGVAGELYISGDGVAAGYLNRPDLTAECFIEIRDWDSDRPRRLYRTGDLARRHADGRLEFLGRTDFQVKVRGFRIELGEIETILQEHPAVGGAVAMVREDHPGDKRLVVYIVPASGQAPASSTLRSYLNEHLPAYMIPALFVTLDALPLTPNRKVDRRALPAPEAEAGRRFVAPREELEIRLARLWEKLLNAGPVGVTDSFFDLGGHSLLSVRLFAEIEQSFGKNLPMNTLFQAPTISHLAEILRGEGWKPSWRSLVTMQPGGTRPPFFCIHEFEGNVFYYHPLARHLGDDQPFFGLQAQGLDGRHEAHMTIEEMAAHYIAEVRVLQPEGPYYLGGSSLGGLVAYEMAQQLHAQGQAVNLLALFDTYSPGYLRLVALPFHYRLARHLHNLKHLSLGEKISYLWQRLGGRLNARRWVSDRAAWIWWYSGHLALRIMQRFGRPLGPALRNLHIREVMIRAQWAYAPKPYAGKITFFHAGERPARYYHDPYLDEEAMATAGFRGHDHQDPVWEEISRLGWGHLAQGGLVVHEVPGPHGYMVREPHAQALGHKLRACLDAAQPTGK